MIVKYFGVVKKMGRALALGVVVPGARAATGGDEMTPNKASANPDPSGGAFGPSTISTTHRVGQTCSLPA